MSSIDLVIGLGADRLNTAIAALFQYQALREHLFSGNQNGEFEGVAYSVSYQINAAPTIELRPPTAQEWNSSIKAGGNTAPPVGNAFLVNLSALNGDFKSGGSDKKASFSVKAVCSAGHAGDKILLSAYSVILDLTALSPMDKFIVTGFLIPRILQGVNQLLAGLVIPTPSLPGVSLTPPSAAVLNNTLVVAYNLVNKGQPDFAAFPLPAKDFFVLMSQPLTQAAANYAATHNIQGQTFDKSGSQGGGGFSADYHVNGRVNNVQVQTTGDPVKLHATVDLSLQASAGINLPFGYILQAGELVYNTVKDGAVTAGNAIKDGFEQAGNAIKSGAETVGNALNPTNW